MFPAAFRSAILFALAWAAANATWAADPAPRSNPGRPAATVPALAGRKFAGIEYVNILHAAAALGLRRRPGGKQRKQQNAGGGFQAPFCGAGGAVSSSAAASSI